MGKMYSFSQNSLQALYTCAAPLQEIAHKAIKVVDFSVIWGFRSKRDQDRFVEMGRSKSKWPSSKHNENPSRAFDIIPYPSGWEGEKEFFFLAGVVMQIAFEKGIPLRWGGAWDGTFNKKEDWDDLAHFQLKDS